MPNSRTSCKTGDLTERQAAVLLGFCGGLTYREVAAELGLSPGTINPVLKAIARKRGSKRIARRCLC